MSDEVTIPDDEEEVPPEIRRCRPARPLWPQPYAHCPEAWMNDRVRALLKGILADEAYDRLPILADALEEAGCEDQLLLRHCRECDEHSSTCWVLRANLAGAPSGRQDLPPTEAQLSAVEAIAESIRRAQQRQRLEADEDKARSIYLPMAAALVLMIVLPLVTGLIIAVFALFLGEGSNTKERRRERKEPQPPAEASTVPTFPKFISPTSYQQGKDFKGDSSWWKATRGASR